MKKIQQLLIWLALSATLTSPALADDTELFNVNPDALISNAAPNVLIILDNSANWDSAAQQWPTGKQGQGEIDSLVSTIRGLSNTINVGLMIFVKSSGSPAGAYVRFGIRPMTGTNTTGNKGAFINVLNSLSVSGDKVGTSDTDYSASMFEAFKYFGGYGTWVSGASVAGSPNDATHFGPGPYAGTQGDGGRRDYSGNLTAGTAGAAGMNTGNALASSTATSYSSPDLTQNCGGNYIIFIGNGYPSQDNGPPLLSNVGGDTTQLPLPSTPPTPNYADEWARFLYSKADLSVASGQQRIVTYTIDVYSAKQDIDQTNLLQSMASGRAGHGRYFAGTSNDQIATALSTIFNEIQSVNTVFAATTLPVSINVRGTNLNQVYMGLFRPDANSLPRWYGNLKEYQLAVDSASNLFLTDARGTAQPAVNATTAQFNPDAISFWTTPDPAPAADPTQGFWSFSPSGSPVTGYDSPDGPMAEKGGVGQMLRNAYPTTTQQANRKIYTCVGCSGTATLPGNAAYAFTATNAAITQTQLQAGSSTERSDIINWLRGQDSLDENLNGLSSDVRASIHGDVLHSRPTVINYNRYASSDDDVVIFYGANDGHFRAVKGGVGPTGGVTAGTEMWSFVPQEFFGNLKRLRDNFPPITNQSGLAQINVISTGTLLSPQLVFLTPQPITALAKGMTVTGVGIAANTYVLGLTFGGTVTNPTITGVNLSQGITTAIAGGSVSFTPNPKPYFADGPIGVYTNDADKDGRLCATSAGACPSSGANDKVQLFIATRRGGRLIYAMDVSDPANPKFMWKHDNTSPGYTELGQTWSQPTVATINLGGVSTPVLIFGAGYDPAVEDQDPIPPSGAGSANTMGRGVFIVRASDGSVIWQTGPVSTSASSMYTAGTPFYRYMANMTYSIPSDVAVIDRDRDGYVDRLYVGDTGGNVWRINIGDPSPANWTVFTLTSVGYAATSNSPSTNQDPASSAAKNQRRKFFYPPDVVPGKDSQAAYDAVLIGSGDREHPFNGYGAARIAVNNGDTTKDDPAHRAADTVLNRFYMFKDRDTGVTAAGTNIGGGTSGAITENQLADNTTTDNSNALIGGNVPRGWFRTLGTGLGTGEKVVGGVVTLGSVTYFNTNVPTPPAPNQCGGNLGEAREYAVSYLTGGAGFDRNNNGIISFVGSDLYTAITNGGFLPSPVAVITQINGKITSGVASGGNIQQGPPLSFGQKIRVYWNKIIDR